MSTEILYTTTSTKVDKKPSPDTLDNLDITEAQLAIDAIYLIMILYARAEAPDLAKSIPIITKVPDILASIAEEKKLAMSAIAQTPRSLFCELDTRLKQMYFTRMDAYKFEMREKEIAWLLLKANSTKECVKKMNTSESSFRYSIRRMLGKTDTASKDAMVSKIRSDVEGEE